MFKVLGGTCGAVLIFGLPAALLMQYSHGKTVRARRVASQLQQRLLEEGDEGSEGAGASEAGATTQSYDYRSSKLFWTGSVLLGFCMLLVAITLLETCISLTRSATQL